MDGEPEVDVIFVVEQEGGSQIGGKIMQVDIQICVKFVTVERHLLDCVLHCL